MDPFFHTLALTYLLYPILGLLLVGLGAFIAKRQLKYKIKTYGKSIY